MQAPYPWLSAYLQQLLLAQAPQGLIIHSPAGRGKAALAYTYAECLLGKEPGKHPDFYEIKPEEKNKSISVTVIRDLIDFSQKGCQLAKQKVVIINSAEKLTIAAQQAFLKALEEPVCRMSYILLCNQISSLLATVKSRCQSLHIKPITYAQAQPWLHAQGCEISEQDYAITAGSPLTARDDSFAKLKSLINDLTAGDNSKLEKAEPDLALKALYYAAVTGIQNETDIHALRQKFFHLDKINAAARDYQQHASLNMTMQLDSLI